MSRAIVIALVAILGIVGLFMSVCGGGFLIMMGYNANQSGLLLIPGFFLWLGATIFWKCFKYLKKPD